MLKFVKVSDFSFLQSQCQDWIILTNIDWSYETVVFFVIITVNHKFNNYADGYKVAIIFAQYTVTEQPPLNRFLHNYLVCKSAEAYTSL